MHFLHQNVPLYAGAHLGVAISRIFRRNTVGNALERSYIKYFTDGK